MKVSEINSNKVKIFLTNTEVLCCFGDYEKLFNMSGHTKALIKALLNDIAENHNMSHYQRLTAKIHAGKNFGCVIILSASGSKRVRKKYTLIFPDSESLLKASLYMQSLSRNKYHKSKLYKINNSYRLIFESDCNNDDFLTLNEFCQGLYSEDLQFEYTKEYGTLLIKDKAVTKIAKTFFKDF